MSDSSPWWVILGDKVDKIQGVVKREKMLAELINGENKKLLSEICEPVDYIPEMIKADQLLTKFDKDHKHDVEYTYVNAFPRSLAPITVSYDQSRLLELSVTFTYDRHFFGGLDRLSRAYRSGQLRKYNDPFQFVNTNPSQNSNLKTSNLNFADSFNRGLNLGLDIDYSKYATSKNYFDPKLKTNLGDFKFDTDLGIDYSSGPTNFWPSKQ